MTSSLVLLSTRPVGLRQGSSRACGGRRRRRDIAIDASRSSAARPDSPRSSSARARPPSARARSSESSCGRAATASSSSSTAPASWMAGRQHASSKPNGRARQELAVPQRARQLGGARERVERGVRTAGAMAGVAELEHHPRALVGVADAELEGGAEPILGLAEGERGDGRLGREQVVRDGTPAPPTGAPPRSGARGRRGLPGCRCSTIRAPGPRRLAGGSPPCARPRAGRRPLCEPARARTGTRGRDRAPRPGARSARPPRSHRSALPVHHRRAPHGVELEVGADHGGELEESLVARVSRESLWLTTSRTVVGTPARSPAGKRRAVSADVDCGGVDQLAPELRDEERVAPGEVADDRGSAQPWARPRSSTGRTRRSRSPTSRRGGCARPSVR